MTSLNSISFHYWRRKRDKARQVIAIQYYIAFVLPTRRWVQFTMFCRQCPHACQTRGHLRRAGMTDRTLCI